MHMRRFSHFLFVLMIKRFVDRNSLSDYQFVFIFLFASVPRMSLMLANTFCTGIVSYLLRYRGSRSEWPLA